MFKLNRHKSDRLGARVDFRLSSFQASQVPKGWERLVLSVVSVETGKTIAKANKAIVRGGTCQWTETFSESIWIPQDNASKEIEDSVLKIVVSMGSHRSSILGEVVVNLTDYMSSGDSGSLLLPLKRCNYGTILQIRIQCLNPTTRFRAENNSKESRLNNNDDVNRKSDGTDNIFNEPVNRDASFSASGSHRSSDSGDSSIGRSNLSPIKNSNGGSYMGRKDSAGSHVSSSSSVVHVDVFSRSNPSSFNSRASGPSTPNRWQDSMMQTSTPTPLRPSDSSKDLLEAAEETIDELQDEAKMWERHAQKLKLDIEKYKKESSDKSKRQSQLDMELSAAYSERDSLKQEVEQLKSSLEELKRRQTGTKAAKGEFMFSVEKELEDELKFLKESNDDLNVQLKRTQEANIELVSILQELEETIEKQRAGEKDPDLLQQIEVLRGKVQELERDCAELTEENLDLIFKLKESGKDAKDGKGSENSESEIGLLKSQIRRLEEQLTRKEFLNGGLNDSSAVQMKNLEKKCADLELELQHFKDQACDINFCESRGAITKENARNESDIEGLKVSFSFKDMEIDSLRHAKNELEVLLTNTQREKTQLDKMLEKKLMELETSKHQYEIQISELEDENVQLSESISGLETQLRYLTNENESNRLELEDSRSLVADHRNEIAEMQSEIDAAQGELKLKQLDEQKTLSDTQEETEYLKRSHSKLQATIESLIEENISLQKVMHEHSAHLEVKLSESRKKAFDFIKRVEFLEGKLSSMQSDIVSKQNSLISQLESIFQEQGNQDEKISQIKLVLNQIDVEKAVEIENLKKEIARLCTTDDERQRTQSDAVVEVSGLRTEKIKLESSLLEALANVKLYETELQSLKLESGKKVQGLVDLLNASKQSEEMLISDIEHMRKQGEAAKSSEEKFKAVASELELKLKASDIEKQQVMEEAFSLRIELKKIPLLQDEILVLKSSLEDANFKQGKFEESLQSVSEECEGLKKEKVEFMEKLSNMQKALHDGENDKRSRIALEEKLLRMEGDLSAKEATYAHEVELKNELNRIKRANSEYQRKVQSLEEEIKELMRKTQVVEKDNIVQDDRKLHDLEATVENLEDKIHLLENDLAESVETCNTYKIQLQRLSAEKESSNADTINNSESENDVRLEQGSKVAKLEAELKDMNERYLNMSLQYAQVEAQREELVMKLKSLGKKGWFS